jgi:hypothetical protein
MATKKITPTNPVTDAKKAEETKPAETKATERKTAGASGRFRKTASGVCRF